MVFVYGPKCCIYELNRDDPKLGQIDFFPDSSRIVAEKAIKGKGVLIGSFEDSKLLGLANYRYKSGVSKLINIASRYYRQGIGSELLQHIFKNCNTSIWCYAQFSAWDWYEKLGMKHILTLDDGRRQYYWEIEDIKKWQSTRLLPQD